MNSIDVSSPSVVDRVNHLASELDILKITNIAKRCCDRRVANDMSVIMESWIKCLDKLELRKLLVTHGHFKSHMALYTEILRVLGLFQLDGIASLIEQYIDYYKSL